MVTSVTMSVTPASAMPIGAPPRWVLVHEACETAKGQQTDQNQQQDDQQGKRRHGKSPRLGQQMPRTVRPSRRGVAKGSI